MLKGFEHVNFIVSDMDKSLHFYCDLIGFELISRKEQKAKRRSPSRVAKVLPRS